MRVEKITCDGCGGDLTTRTNSVDYRLVLAAESKPGYGAGAYTDMMIYPPVDRAHHFCGIGCLDRWRDRAKHKAALWKQWWDKWKDEKGTKAAAGRFSSYPSPPGELTDAAEIEFEESAMTAYPMSRPK